MKNIAALLLAAGIVLQVASALPPHTVLPTNFSGTASYLSSNGVHGTTTGSNRVVPGSGGVSTGTSTFVNSRGQTTTHTWYNTYYAPTGVGSYSSNTTYYNGATSSSVGQITYSGGSYNYYGTKVNVQGQTLDVSRIYSKQQITTSIFNTDTGNTLSSVKTFSNTASGYTESGSFVGAQGNTATNLLTVVYSNPKTNSSTNVFVGPLGNTKSSSGSQTFTQTSSNTATRTGTFTNSKGRTLTSTVTYQFQGRLPTPATLLQ